MIVAHKIQLDPTVAQAKYFAQAAGTARFVWNWALDEWDRQYKDGGKPSGMSLKREFNKVKYELFPWLDGIHRDAHAAPFANLQKAFVKFFKKTAKRPKRKKKDKSRDSFAIANDKLRVEDNRVRLPIIGWIKMTESIRFGGKIMSATVSRIADRWYISFSIDVGDYKKERTGDGTVGVDLGIKTLAVTSDGEEFQAPKPLKKFKKKLKRAQRRLAKRVKGSKRRNKQKRKVAKLYAKIASIRQDCLHKLTTYLCKNHAVVVIEDLCVKGMLKNRKLSRAIADLGFYELRRQLGYKSGIYGTLLVVADRWFPSSKTCSNCQTVKDSLSLAERIFKCESCGFEIDRDLNAAENLCTLGLRETYARGPEGSGRTLASATKPCRVETRTKPRANSRSLTN
jgi:putative transposase